MIPSGKQQFYVVAFYMELSLTATYNNWELPFTKKMSPLKKKEEEEEETGGEREGRRKKERKYQMITDLDSWIVSFIFYFLGRLRIDIFSQA